jgi:Uma2 family endonuclease
MLVVTSSAKRVSSFDQLYAEIERLPEGITGQILVPGMITTLPRPTPAHQYALQGIGHDLRRQFDPKRASNSKRWWILPEVEIRLPGGRLAVPDLAGWRVDRVPRMPSENPIVTLPDWCAEVLSPSTAATDRAVKLTLYAKCGVGHVWMVDPTLRLVEAYETRGERPTLVATARDAETDALPPFEAGFDLGGWWAEEPVT